MDLVDLYTLINTYLESFAIVSDIFSGRTIFVPYQMSTIEKFSFRSPNNSEKFNRLLYVF